MSIKRKYLSSHPWINFEVNLLKFPYTLWIALGEAQARCEDIAGTPLEPEVQKLLLQVYLAKGAHATTAIEGNTLSEEQVKKRIEGQLTLPASQEYLGKEIDNIIIGYNEIKDTLLKGGETLCTTEEIKKFNKIVLQGLNLAEEVVPGHIREHSVGVARYLAAPAEDCEYLLNKLCPWLDQVEFAPPDNLIAFGLIKAIIAHLYIAWIHPFADGNGRTARLLELKILLSHSVPAVAAHLLSNHYNLTRNEYYKNLDYASRSGGDIIPFIQYAIQGFLDGLKEQLKYIRDQQMKITWRNYIYDVFKNKSGNTNERRRKLVLDLSEFKKAVPLKEIRHISTRIAEHYANKTDRTILRDLNALMEIDLVQYKDNGFLAKTQVIEAFLPDRRNPS